jgi:UDP-N-acetylenolpyruvoylglucosamine reductase
VTSSVGLDAERLRNRLTGRLVLPEDEEWDAARRSWRLTVDQRPEAVVFAASPDDVVAVLDFARARGLRVAAQRTGHGSLPLGSLQRSILLKTNALASVEVDGDTRRARVQAGADWAAVIDAAQPHGLAPLSGSSSRVGVVGYTLGGGYGWLARKYGISSASVVSAEVVTADGRQLLVDRDHEPELFWALRGGGGTFAVVLSLELELFPAPTLYAGDLFFPFERAAEVLHAWREWIRDVPEELTSLGTFLQFPPLPQIPEPLRARSFVVIEAAFLGNESDGRQLFEPLRELGAEIDTLATIRPSDLDALHMDPPEPVPAIGDGLMLSDLSPETIDAYLAAAGPGSESPLLATEIRHLGGAAGAARPGVGEGALVSLPAPFHVYSLGIGPTPQADDAVRRRLELVRDHLAPWTAPRWTLNLQERPGTSGVFDDDTSRRLLAVKAEYDPDDLIQSNHELSPA